MTTTATTTTTFASVAEIRAAVEAGRAVVYVGSLDSVVGSRVLAVVPGVDGRVNATIRVGGERDGRRVGIRGASVTSFEIAAPVADNWLELLLG